MPIAPLNTDLPSSYKVPGARFRVYYTGGAPGVENLQKRLLILGYKLASGNYAQDTPVAVLSQDDCNQKFGQGSDAAREFAAQFAQVGGGVLDVYVCGIVEPAAGTAATYALTVAGPATTQGSIDLWICGYKVSIVVQNGDTATIIGTNLAAAINLVLDIPVTANAAAGVVTLTYRHKGLTGEDLPVRCNVNNATGVSVSPCALTFASAAVGAGSVKVTSGALTVSAALAGGEASTVVATKVAAAINAANWPCTAVAVGSVVTLNFATDRDVRRIQASVVTSTGTTVNAGSGATDGTGSATSSSYNGTQGAGAPSLTAALTNIGALPAFPVWCVPFTDAASLGAISTHIELYSNGQYQKSQYAVIGSCLSLAVSGALPTASAPALTASPRYEEAWCPDFPQQGYELAARRAAALCKEDYIAQNWDGYPLQTRGTVPMLLPAVASRASEDDQNSALRTYLMTPVAVAPGNKLAIVRATTTFSTSDELMQDPASIRQLDNLRVNVATRLNLLFGSKNLKLNSTPQTSNTFTLNDVKDAIIVLLRELERIDLYDGVDAFKAGVSVSVDPVVPTRLDVGVPEALVRNIHSMSGTINRTS